MFFQLLMQKNEFFEQFCTFFVLENFFIRLLVFSVEALENCHFWPIFQFLTNKIPKIAKIAKFQMNLEHTILIFFLHLKRRWKAEKQYFNNFEKTNFFKRLQKKILEKKLSNFCCNQKIIFFEKSIFASKSI